MSKLIGRVEDYKNYYFEVLTEDGDWHYLTAQQNSTKAKVGDRVELTYHSTSSYGLWFISKVLPNPVMSDNKKRRNELIDAVHALLDAALERHTDRTADETFVECHICGGWDSHMERCPIPALQEWQNLPES